MNNVGCNKYGNESRVPWWQCFSAWCPAQRTMSPGCRPSVTRSHVTTRIGLSSAPEKQSRVHANAAIWALTMCSGTGQ